MRNRWSRKIVADPLYRETVCVQYRLLKRNTVSYYRTDPSLGLVWAPTEQSNVTEIVFAGRYLTAIRGP